MSQTDRRRFLGALAGAAFAPAAIAHPAFNRPAGPDARLIQLCDEFTRLEQERAAVLEATDDDKQCDIIFEQYSERMAVLMDAFNDMPARTLDGARAKARAVSAYAGDLVQENGYWDHDMVASLLRDLAGEAA